MSNIQDQVRQDAASLHAFVCSVSDKCERRNGAVSYPEPSERFFSYISELAAKTKSYLQAEIEIPDKTPEDCLDLRRDIAILQAGWGFMHQFVKPVLDADTLKLPTAFLQGLIARFQDIPRYSSTDFIFYHSSQLNYFNVKLGVFKPRADQISRFVDGPKFPENLGLIGIPYSQSSSLFINCLIPHEMGHYVFGELSLRKLFCKSIEETLINCLGNSVTGGMRTALIECIANWVEELFCDLFAVRLMGFCFSLAFVELFNSATALDDKSKYQESKEALEFDPNYPSNLFRLRQQVAVLKSDGWWEELQKTDSHYVRTLEVAYKLKEDSFSFEVITSDKSYNSQQVVETFFGILPNVIKELDAITGDILDGSALWKSRGKLIEEYLKNGVVPSSLIPKSGYEPVFPSPVALINASYRYYVDVKSLPKFLSSIEDTNCNSIGELSYWVRRVEMWTVKAIEDVILLSKGRH
ncbi:MAG: hypothetical protein ACLPXT_12235 [Terracidiphilus sp.]